MKKNLKKEKVEESEKEDGKVKEKYEKSEGKVFEKMVSENKR